MTALARDPRAALTINTYDHAYRVLCAWHVRAEVMQQVVPEYVLMARQMLGEAADGWPQQVQAMLPAMRGMARVAITSEGVGIIDFQQRFPSVIERTAATLAPRRT
jgi:hypothetical protein